MRTLLARGTLSLWQVVRRGPALETRGNVCAAPGQHLLKACAHPGLGFRRPQLVQCPGRFLDVPQDVEQVEHVLVAASLGVIALITGVRE